MQLRIFFRLILLLLRPSLLRSVVLKKKCIEKLI